MVSSAGTTAYTYDAADRLLSAGTTSYGYDHNGNQVTKITGATTVNYTFDALNRLGAVSGGGINSQFQYDGDGKPQAESVGPGRHLSIRKRHSHALRVVLNEAV